MKRLSTVIAAGLLVVAVMGWNPLSPYRDTRGVLSGSFTAMETGIQRQPNGVFVVKALTRMPEVKADMVRWWFSDYMQTTEHYKRWHPTAHVWMDWENKVPGEIVGASHLVHEYLGTELHKLRIQFVDPGEFLNAYQSRDNQFVVCAKVGLLEEPINVTSMCHVVRNTDWGAEMRSIFWLGHIAKRDGNNEVTSLEGVLGNTALTRLLVARPKMAQDLMVHAIEEMGYLSDFLPSLYRKETLDSAESIAANQQ
ncbi:DAPG hydrolase family protein [Biformimicrobium ophioploci]|uniref:DAPG hydrolase PhiG domain-containing protein n=1 Tax=Biformimicrobium ophioploci TaxID=3036711 RepID=A0ABQ6LUI4_9GAMM|nr:hypothetical protein [Microbulbifer sp. NKW57]GMG85750.1 hypothetical protein MNKW57_00710 [Microbulbifer sp. NKW57]